MKTQRTKLSVLALLTLTIQVYANQATTLVGDPVKYTSSHAVTDTERSASDKLNRSELPAAIPAAVFDLTPPETIRAALQRWATQAGWTFGPEFYSIPADYSVAKAESLGTDFKAAVRALLDSTAMSEVPAQPCFYSNQVLRIVPKHELCTRP